MYSSLLTLALSFTALSSTLAASNVAPEIGKRDLHFGSSSDPVPGEILSSFESNDNEGANARRSPGLQFGGFEDLPTEVQDHITATRLAKRDSRKNCGPNRDGNVKTWVPVETWKENAQYFCSSFAQYGSALEIDDGKEPGKGWVWNSYDVALSQQDDAKYKRGVPGDPGRIAFFLHNTKRAPTGTLDYDACIAYQEKQSNGPKEGKSKCWGSKHDDTRGGTWKVDDFGEVGGFIYSGSTNA